MKAARPPSSSRATPSSELLRLRARLADADATLRAIRSGEVDAVVVAGKKGDQVFTLDGAERAYRVLIESMNEGAVTLTADKTILYANQCFARMVKCPLEQVTGGSMRRFLSTAGRAVLRPLLRQLVPTGSKIQLVLNATDGSQLPVQVSIQPVAGNGPGRAIIAVVVTDMTEARRTEELLRALTNRVLQVQETERGRVALELHDHITQLLCAILFRSQALVDELSTKDGPSLREAMKLREMLGTTAAEVERISRNLRPGVLDQLGLVAVLRATSTEFAQRTGLPVELACVQLTTRLAADTELTFFRILQEALKNVEQHARARQVGVSLVRQGAFVQLTITDDGVGFDSSRRPAGKKGKGALGLLGMRERAAYAGGILDVKSARGTGTEIVVRIPLLAKVPAKAALN